MTLFEKLKQWRLTIAGCALMSGVAVGTLEDTRHWVISSMLALLPSPTAQVACVDSYLGERAAKNTGQYRIVLTQLANDNDLSQTAFMDRSLRRLYGEDLDSAIQLETVDCTLFSGTGNAAERVKAATELATKVANKLSADVVIWGEVINSNQSIGLRLSHAQGTGSKDYEVDEGAIGVSFGTDVATIFAAKILTAVTLTNEQEGSYVVPRMRRVLTLTTPLIEKTPPGISANDLGSLWNAHAEANYWIGLQSGNNAKLEEAVAAYRAALEKRTRDRVPLDWAATQHNLGNALSNLGERESTPDRVEEAVTAYRAALEERTRDRFPLHWANTQNNLGTALQTLGARESGTDRLKEAVVAHRATLEEYTRDRVPLYWAMAQHNLGTALSALGERDSSTDGLEEAVTAYRAALDEYTRDRVPLDWAMTQHNLGFALSRLGARESGTDRLEEAVVAYRAALEEYTRERVPLDWAMTQNNLGSALLKLGERESGTKRLKEAVVAYRAALEEYTRDRVPLDWAMTLGNEGAALRTIAERRRDRAVAEQALQQLEMARSTFEAAGHEPYLAYYAEQAEQAQALVMALRKGK